MKETKNTREKICAFYTNDYHFEMMSLPYIDTRMEKDDEIIILTENSLEESMQTLLERTNLKEDKKKQILELDWKNNDSEKIKSLEPKIKDDKNTIIFVKGKEKYIQQINEDLRKKIPNQNHVKIIDCYELEEIGENLREVMNQYDKILKTAGEKEIEKIE
ncbi:MAG: hypothetical protein HFJ34_02160 [Clostridia bacterium]|nr:hypothetical protein [Clostridia bacterium]